MPSIPLVSIVIPVFNGADYLGDAIESALAQTYRATEVVVVDDGSDDGGATRRIAAAFGSRIRFLHKPNGGVATALNLGIEAMQGELFSWLSHDDLYRPEKVERQVAAWQAADPRAVMVGDFQLIDEVGRPGLLFSLADIHLAARPLDAIMERRLNGCAMLIPRSAFAEIGRFDPGLPTTQDYDLWLRMAHRLPFVHVAAADTLHRRHARQGSRHPAHIREAERLFLSALTRLPAALMRAYEGSEPGFLLRQRSRMTSYPAVVDQIDRQVARLCGRREYDCVVLTPGGRGLPAAADQAIAVWSPAPRRVACVDAGRDALDAAVASAAAGWLLVAAADRLPSAEAVRTGFLEQARSDADLVLLGEGEDRLPGDGLLLRRESALAVLAAVADGGIIDRTRLDPALLAVSARGASGNPATPPRPARTDLQVALAGQAICSFHGPGAADAILAALDAAGRPSLPRILFLVHGLGGGTVVHLRELCTLLSGRALPVILYGAPGGRFRLSLSASEGRHGVRFDAFHQYAALLDVLRSAALARADVLHASGFEDDAMRLLADLGLPHDATLVDYDHFAHSPHLADADGRFHGDDAVARRDAKVLRAVPAALVRGAERVIAISRDLCFRVSRIAPDLPLVCAAHWAHPAPERRTVLPLGLGAGEALRILLIGWIGPSKGSRVVADAVRIARARSLPLRFHVLGDIDPAPPPLDDVLTVESTVDFSRLRERIGAFGAHVAWHPAQVPETWSYALSEMMEAGLPIAASALGALAERCAGRTATWLLPWDSPADAWVDFFLRLHATGLALPPRWAPTGHLPKPEPFYPDRYLAPVLAGRRQAGAQQQ